MGIQLSGLASGFDWQTLVDQLADVERAPQRTLLTQQSRLEERNTAYGSIQTELGVLQSKVKTLADLSLYDSRTAATSDNTLATTEAGTGALTGSHIFNFIQLATASRQVGVSNAGRGLNATNDVSGLVLSEAGFAAPISDGTFTVNGKQITIAAADTLQEVFDKISTATGGTVTGTYDAGTDTINLASAGEIVLGSATDTSNFLTAARLSNNGTGLITSSSALGAVRANATLENANFGTVVSDGGSGAGEFKINGVSISFNAAEDTVSSVLKRINDSSAGVSASYDPVNDRFILANKTTGDIGVALEDVTGNFLTASGLTGGTIERGKDLIYTVNGGGQLTSHSNTINENGHGVGGLTVTALKADGTGESPVTITVSNDTEKVKTAITDFVEAYNRAQGLIDTHTASSTDAKGVVTAGVLASDGDASAISSSLRSLVYSQVTGLTGVLDHLADLGIATNGEDNKISLEDSEKLDSVLSGNLDHLRQLFADETNGIAVKLDAYLERMVGDDGSLIAKKDGLAKQAKDIDTQVADLEKIVQANRERMIASFVAMETAQSRLNQQLQFLAQQLGT